MGHIYPVEPSVCEFPRTPLGSRGARVLFPTSEATSSARHRYVSSETSEKERNQSALESGCFYSTTKNI